MDYEGDSEEEEEADAVTADTAVDEPKKEIDPVVAPEVSADAVGEDDDAESPNKRAKLT